MFGWVVRVSNEYYIGFVIDYSCDGDVYVEIEVIGVGCFDLFCVGVVGDDWVY